MKWESQEILWMAFLELKVTMETRETQDVLEILDVMVEKEIEEKKAKREVNVNPATVQKEKKVILEFEVKMDEMVTQEYQVLMEPQGYQVKKVTKDVMDLKEIW